MMHSDGVSELNEIDYGASKIILEVAGYCYLAIVVWGEPPKSFLPRVRKVFRDLIQEYGTQIEHFEGDLSTIPEQINTQLETLRNFQAKQEHSDPNKPSPLMLIGVAVVGLIAIPWGFFHYRDSVNRDVEKTITTALLSTPELAVYRLNAVAESGKLKLVGQVPNLVLRQRAEHIVSGVVSRVAPQWSIDNHITAVDVPPDPVLASAEVQRVAATLNQTLSTAISARYAARQVLVEGKISQSADAQQITRAFARIPGVQSVSNTVQVQPLQIETRFYFEAASATLNSADLVSKIPLIKSFLNQQATVNLKIIGHSRSSGSPIVDQDLALRRANVVRDALIRQGTDPRRLQAMGTTHLPPGVTDDQSAWLSRCVVLEVIPMATLPPKRAH
ncbi:MAG: OmpA family protein [Leptolyngbyaceae cyanobacterium CSU_1_3]|nr:OmpA family protein [Leptolyngbyaceae cyanobacterium CSU_1_3]